MRLLVDGDVDPVRDVEHHRVRVAERKNHLLTLQLRAVSDADDVELALEAVDDAGHRVGDEAPGETVERTELRSARLRLQVPVGQLEVDPGRNTLPQLALRPLELDRAIDHLDGDAFRYRDRFLANS